MKIKYVPTTNRPTSSAHITPRSVRNVPLHSERYNPTRQRVGPLMSLIHLGQLSSRQQDHMIQQIRNAHKIQLRKQNHSPFQHRTDYAFYLNGLSASLHNRDLIPDSVVNRYKLHPPTQDNGLYYGRGLMPQAQDIPPSRALDKYKERLKQQSDITNLDLSLLQDYPLNYTSRANTPASPLLLSTSPPATMATRGRDSAMGNQRTFVTEGGTIDEEPDEEHTNYNN